MQNKSKERLLKNSVPLLLLEGSWQGIGTGSFPTMNPFRYREETNFKIIKQQPYLHFTQIAWLIKGHTEELIHWETGFISAVKDNKFRMYCCHMNGRIEVLIGIYSEALSKHRLKFKSESIRNGVDLKSALTSKRILRFDENSLAYAMEMCTTDVSTSSMHLKAKLVKQKFKN